MYVSITIDVEKDLHSNTYNGITKGLSLVKKVFDKYGIKPTLFVTGECIEKFPKLFRTLEKEGWEIASHSYHHKRLDNLPKKELEKEIIRVKQVFKKHKINLSGFRAPQYSGNKELINILAKYGFKYDSSVASHDLLQLFFFPSRARLWFSQFFKLNRPFKIGKIVEIPPTAILLSLSGLTLRILPLFLFKLLLKFVHKKPLIFAFHSWDFIEIKKSKIYKVCRVKKFLMKFEKIINYLKVVRRFKKLSTVI